MVNLKLAVDDIVLKRALEEGTSVNAQVRAFLHRYAGTGSGFESFLALTEGLGARSGPEGRTLRRAALQPGSGTAFRVVRAFVDTNALVYAVDEAEPRRRGIAREILTTGTDGGLVVSTQVLSEFLVTVRRLEVPVEQERALEIAST